MGINSIINVIYFSFRQKLLIFLTTLLNTAQDMEGAEMDIGGREMFLTRIKGCSPFFIGNKHTMQFYLKECKIADKVC